MGRGKGAYCAGPGGLRKNNEKIDPLSDGLCSSYDSFDESESGPGMCARRDPGPIWVPTLAPAGPKNPASRSQEFAGDQKKQNACSWNIGNCSFRCLKIQIFACGACHHCSHGLTRRSGLGCCLGKPTRTRFTQSQAHCGACPSQRCPLL